MAKKKATMTLKDFHGGSIPSDLPLPSAPGVIVRPSNHVGFDRQSSWGNPMGRPDHRLRPGSAGAVRNFDDKTPFLSHTAQIGRNFDEDERKPLDGNSAPRRTVSDESIRGAPVRQEQPKLEYSSAGSIPSRPATTPASQLSSVTASSYAARFSEAPNLGVNSQSGSRRALGTNDQNAGGGNSGQAVSAGSPNAWGRRKETVGVAEPVATSWSAPDAATKLAHASALEKVASGRWHSKQHQQIDVEVIRHPETEGEAHIRANMYSKNTYSMDVPGGREFNDATLVRHAERSLAIDDGVPVGVRELPGHERSRSPIYPDMKEKDTPVYADGIQVQHPRNAGTFNGSELQRPVSSESSERPKLKLLPRSKPVETVEAPVVYIQPSDPLIVHSGGETYVNANPIIHGLAGSESGNPAVERPKLSLRPRSQPVEQLERNAEKERNSLFGGARPRELVLKERGLDDVSLNNHDLNQSPNRMRQDSPRTETLPLHSTPIALHNTKVENAPLDHRIGKIVDRRDHRVDVEKPDVQRRNWRNDNRRNNRELEKQQQQQERPPSPETWRKPVEQAPSPGTRYGKAASAVELAQAFSRSVSNPKIADRGPGQRVLPGQGQIPFSRLTNPQPRPQINGY